MTSVKSVLAAILLISLSNAAFAGTRVQIGFGFGNRGSNRDNYPNHRFNRESRRNRPARWQYPRRRGNIYIGGGFQYSYRWPSYYVYTSPTIIRTPVIVEEKTVLVSTGSPQVVQPVETESDADTQALLKAVRLRKTELLEQLKTGYKEQRKEAIKELAGFCFDDEVRKELENVLLLDPDEELRQEVIRTFAAVNNTEALPALEKARVEDWSQDVRKEADKAIKSIKGS